VLTEEASYRLGYFNIRKFLTEDNMTFWDVSLSSSESVRRFEGMHFLQIQGVMVRQGRNQQEAGGKLSV
jgi:hypothetical protein